MCLQWDFPFQAKYNSGAQYRDLADSDAAERLFLYFPRHSPQRHRRIALLARSRRDTLCKFFADSIFTSNAYKATAPDAALPQVKPHFA
jgi:hypothetical protein